MSEIIRLVNLCEKASESSFPINLAIARLDFYREENGDMGDDDVPDFTGSLDAAVSLVPKDWYWQVGFTTSFQAWANVYQTHPDHGEKDRNEFHSNRPYWEFRKWTPALALCHAALRAQASQIK